MNNPAQKKLQSVYFHNLDAGRFLAAFAVFIFHFSNELKGLYPDLNENFFFKAYYTFASKGNLGVNFFFVLSGFLITYLILQEKKQTNYFNLRKFLIRRTLRIWPLYFIIILIGFILLPLLFTDYSTMHEPINFIFFLANFDEIYYGANDTINFLTSPWSVAVEEQFYLFWGIVIFILFKSKKFRLEYLIVVLYLLSFYFRWVYMKDETILYYHTFAVCQDILTGAFIALSLFQKKQWIIRLAQIPKITVLIMYVLGIMICLFKNKIFFNELIVFERFVLSFFFAFVILDQIQGKNSLFKFGKIKLFNQLGKISYGIYMYHLVIMYLFIRFFSDFNLSTSVFALFFFVLSFVLTVGLAVLSYRFIESKFLSLKPKQ